MAELRTVLHAKSPAEAAIVKALLSEAGIPVFVLDGPLMDEFAASQRVLGGVGCEVQVPDSCVEEAQRLIEENRREFEPLDDRID